MSAFENATRVFHACESSEGWEGCRQYVEPGVAFEAQAGPLAEFDTVEDYAEWMADVPSWMPDGRYDLHTSAWDEENRAAMTIADSWSLNLNKMIMQATGLDGWAHSGGSGPSTLLISSE